MKAIQLLATDFNATLRQAQPIMEELNSWLSSASDIQSSSEHNDVDPRGPMLLGGHIVKVFLFRAILRPFIARTDNVRNNTPLGTQEAEARRLARVGAQACVANFTAFTLDLKSTWLRGFWPFCTSPVPSLTHRCQVIPC